MLCILDNLHDVPGTEYDITCREYAVTPGHTVLIDHDQALFIELDAGGSAYNFIFCRLACCNDCAVCGDEIGLALADEVLLLDRKSTRLNSSHW